ncbi:MAG: ABC transporter ATP-binding protein [Actinomycetota bacterium]|nr:ABC transporter ATP-binding protein [Actinomycetota bacterium]
MSLRADLRVARDAFALELPLEVADGETVALLGPNGTGKTTALRALAGLLPLRSGTVVLGDPVAGDTVLEDPARRIRVPPERRPVGVVFQDYLLFPHLSALENVAFGLRASGVRRPDARRRAGHWLERVGLGAYGHRRPRELSGGQAQRVALARALARQPRLLLLDEPLAALDAATRLETRAELGRHLASFDASALVVTHDPLDAMVLADRLVVVEDGRVVQAGTPPEVARRPRTDYVARLVGLNLYRGVAAGATVSLPSGSSVAVAEQLHGNVFVAFPPSAVALHRTRPEGTPRNVWPGSIRGVERHGDVARVAVEGALPVLADVTPGTLVDLELAPGAPVWAAVKATEVRAYPA